MEACLIAVLVCMQPGTQERIWAGDVGMVDIVMDGMLDSSMVVECKGTNGITREDVKSEKRTDNRTLGSCHI